MLHLKNINRGHIVTMTETVVIILFAVIFLILIGIVYYLYQMETMGATNRSTGTATAKTALTSASAEWLAKRLDSKSVVVMAEVSAVPDASQAQCLATFALPAAVSSFSSTDGIMVLSKDGQDANGTNVSTVNPDSISLSNQTINMSFFPNNTTTHTLTFVILFYSS